MLIVFGGLPGVGKTTLARAVARELGATYLRIDTIEQALRSSGNVAEAIGPKGYQVAYALAEESLRLGQTVVADSVNPLTITRDAWRRVAASASVTILEIEVICSDTDEHQQRVEARLDEIPGPSPLSWRQVVERHYEQWDRAHLVLDTAGHLPVETLTELLSRIRMQRE